MCDFDLSQALESSDESDEMEMKHCPPEADVDEVLNLCTGLSLEVSKQPCGMRKMATLVVALNRMKAAFTPRSSEFTDEQLFSIIVENIEYESPIEKVEYCSVYEAKRPFEHVGSGRQCNLCDTSHKDVVRLSEALELHALTVKGGECVQKVNFSLLRYADFSALQGQVQPIVLSIIETDLYISCSVKNDEAVLLLEVCEKEELRTIESDGAMARFLFYRKTTGTQDTFESVKYPGWVMSTSTEERHLVELCKADTAPHPNFNVKYL